MRTIVNISLPENLAKDMRSEVKRGQFASTSEFFRHLLRAYKQDALAKELHADRRAFAQGKGKTLRSLRDLR